MWPYATSHDWLMMSACSANLLAYWVAFRIVR